MPIAVRPAALRAGEGGLFENFLVTPLQGAVALAQMDDVAMAIAENLHLDMPGFSKIAFDIDFAGSERRLGFGLRQRDRAGQFFRRLRELHAAATAAGRGLDQNWESDVTRDRGGFRRRFNRTVGAGHARYAKLDRRPLGGDLVAHGADVIRFWADEGKAVLDDNFREGRILRQKPDARMDRIGPGHHCGRENCRNIEIAVARRRWTDANTFVGQPHMHGAGIRRRVYRDGLDAHLAAGPVYPERDVATIGDQDLLVHRP